MGAMRLMSGCDAGFRWITHVARRNCAEARSRAAPGGLFRVVSFACLHCVAGLFRSDLNRTISGSALRIGRVSDAVLIAQLFLNAVENVLDGQLFRNFK